MKLALPRLLLAACLLTGCASSAPHRVSPQAFADAYARTGRGETMFHHRYLGVRAGHAYLEEGRASLWTGRWKFRVICVELDRLDPAFRAGLPKLDYAPPPR